MMMTTKTPDIEVLEQALANYEALYNDWQYEMNDGTWNREETEANIEAMRAIIERMKYARDYYSTLTIGVSTNEN